jgi:tetratricopeptide (TPR) repeat protein
VALKLFLFAASPAAPRTITAEPVDAGEFDFRHFARLERLVHEARTTLTTRFPALPHGAIVSQHQLPLLTEYAFAGSRALQVWYRDSTLQWVRFTDFEHDPHAPVVGVLEYEPRGPRQVALVEGDAVRGLFTASDRARTSDWAGALAALDHADSVQRDTAAAVFFATTAAKRALCLESLGRGADAEASAHRALALWPRNPDARYTLAELRLGERRYAEAETLLIAQLTMFPADRGAAELLERTRAAWRASLTTPASGIPARR